jgi:hypothetical protein
MSGRFASPRFRRRFIWSILLVGSATGVVVTAALVGNTAHPEPETFSNTPVTIARSPKLARLGPVERQRLLETSLLFVRTAVARRDLDRAYELAGPELVQGMTRAEWRHGNIPVVPFPAIGVAEWDVAYSYENDVAFTLSLVAKPGTSPVVGKTFTIELTRPSGRKPWRVASWFPTGISSVRNDPKLAAAAEQVPKVQAGLSLWWLFLPVGMLATVIVIPAALGARHWWIGRRSERAYLSERGYSR